MEATVKNHLYQKAVRCGIPLHSTFELTARCNFRCPMCYVRLSAEEQRRRGRELTGAEWISIAEQVKRAGTVFLLLTGGEPLLHPDFCQIYEKLSQMGFVINVNSNAALIDEEQLALFRKYPPRRFNITLYAASAEGYRRQCGMPAYDDVLRGIRLLRDNGCSVRISLTLTPTNRAELPELLRMAQALGTSVQASFYLSPPVRVNPDMTGKNLRLPPEDAAALQLEYNRLRLGEPAFSEYAQRILAAAAAPQKGAEPIGEKNAAASTAAAGTEARGAPVQCRAGRAACWIDWQGNLLSCGELAAPSESLLSCSFDEAWQRLRAAVSDIRLAPACAACPLQSICSPCAAKNFTETGSFEKRPDYVCELTHAYVELLRSETGSLQLAAGNRQQAPPC